MGFTPIIAIFYSAFHPTGGPQVLCQVPSGAIVPPTKPDSSTLQSPLFRFDLVKNYVIPKPQLCNRLVTFKVGRYRVVGFPVKISDPSYSRNLFVFNFSFVFLYEGESIVYETSIRRLGRMFMALEEQSRFLSKRTSYETIDSLLQQIYQDINNFSECMIPIDESNTVNMKLFPLFPSPPDLKAYQVPISTVRLESMVDVNWDPTMEKIVPFINGINSVRRIADLADADYDLVRKCIQHLMHYGCIIIVDLFQFSSIYAPTSEISMLIKDPVMMKECQAYVFHPGSTTQRMRFASHNSGHSSSNVHVNSTTSSLLSTSSSSFSTIHNPKEGPHLNSPTTLFMLYRSLHQGQTVREWYNEYKKQLRNIDVRRFLSFGVIKRLIYRVHSYPISDSLRPEYEHLNRASRRQHHHNHQQLQLHQRKQPPGKATKSSSVLNSGSSPLTDNGHLDMRKSSFNSIGKSPGSDGAGSYTSGGGTHNNSPLPHHLAQDAYSLEVDDMISSILHEPRNFDAICTDMRIPRAEVERILKQVGDWTVISC